MEVKTLNLIAVTDDPSITAPLTRQAPPGGQWELAVFPDAARIFSSSLKELHMLVLDESTTGANYTAVIKKARKRFPALEAMVIGGPKSDDIRVTDKREAVDCYFERPLDPALLATTLDHRLQIAALKSQVGLVGRSPEMEELVEAILQVGPTEVPILIEGESGTGKDVIARAVHHASRRRNNAYVAINCASLAEGVLESELFGHEKGSFTGAVSQRSGVFERADKGTIFLDEVGEMSANMQVRLLRVLESGEVLRVGGAKSFRVDVRVVAATNRRLAEVVAAGSFRQDLYYRLKGVSFYLPPLRQRKSDIPLLVDHFIRDANRRHAQDIKAIDADALRELVSNPWPGNIRELRNLIDTAVVLTPGNRITHDVVRSQLGGENLGGAAPLLPVPVQRTKDEAEREMIYASILAVHRDIREILGLLKGSVSSGPLDSLREVPQDMAESANAVPNLSHLERAAIVDALRVAAGNRRKASEMLGISERTLYRKIKEYGLV